MLTYIILSRVQPGSIKDPKDFKSLAEKVSKKIKEECPGVHWHESYATLGRFDVVDIVESDSIEEVQRCAMVIRSVGDTVTETMSAVPWKKFLASL